MLPNPRLGLGAENFAGSGPFDGFDQGEYTVSVEQRLERGGKRRARVALAKSDEKIAELLAEQARLDTIHEVRQAYVDVLAAAASLANTKVKTTLAEELEATVRRRVQKARDPALAERRIAVQVLEIRTERDRAQRQLNLSKRRLSLLWGDERIEFYVNSAELNDVSADFDDVDRSAVHSVPDVMLRTAGIARAEAAVSLETAIGKQDPTFSLGVRHLGESDDVAAIASVSMPIAFFNTNRGNIERANAEKRRASLQSEAARRHFSREVTTQRETARTARFEALAYRDEIVPMATKALEAARAGYNRGGFTFLDVLDAQRTLSSLQSREISALKKYHLARASLDRLTARFQAPFSNEEAAQ
jgi:cobalt-zinc-cadmium efflux system outer membrane protein